MKEDEDEDGVEDANKDELPRVQMISMEKRQKSLDYQYNAYMTG